MAEADLERALALREQLAREVLSSEADAEAGCTSLTEATRDAERAAERACTLAGNDPDARVRCERARRRAHDASRERTPCGATS